MPTVVTIEYVNRVGWLIISLYSGANLTSIINAKACECLLLLHP